MATVTEFYNSRGGSISNASVLATRVFTVVVDNQETDNPIAILQRHRDGVPYAQIWPEWNFARAYNYRIVDHKDCVFKIQVEYVNSSFFNEQQWILSVSSSSVEDVIYQTVSPDVIEVPGGADTEEDVKTIGPPIYLPVDPVVNPAWTHRSKKITDPVAGTQSEEFLVKSEGRVKQGYNTERGTALLSLSRKQITNPYSAIRSLVAVKNKYANVDVFYGAEPGEVYLKDFYINQVPGFITVEDRYGNFLQNASYENRGYYFEVRLEFVFDADGVDYIYKVHEYRLDEYDATFEILDRYTNEKVVERFKIRDRISFTNMLNSLND